MDRFSLKPITSKENKQLKAAAKLIQGKKYRQQQGRFLAEGLRLCGDILRSGLCLRQLFLTQEELERSGAALDGLLDRAEEAFTLPAELAARLSDTQTPQGVFGVFDLPQTSSEEASFSGRRFLLLCSLQDPGNIGTILRSCEAFGVDEVVLSADCPDLYSPKLLRATMGGLFRLRHRVVPDMAAAIRQLQGEGVRVYATALRPDSIPITQVDFSAAPSAVAIGNEGNGLSQQLLDCCDAAVIIPMEGAAESLNAAVAASISIWEMSRQSLCQK